MSENKDLLKKLLTVVAKQQQVITKLAQAMEAQQLSGETPAAADPTPKLHALLEQAGGVKSGVGLAAARGPLSDGSLRIQLRVPASNPNVDSVVSRFKALAEGAFPGVKVEITKLIG